MNNNSRFEEIIVEAPSFKDVAIVSCGTMSLEINSLVKQGFLDTEHIFFTTPGLHQDILELEAQLIKLIQKAKSVARGG